MDTNIENKLIKVEKELNELKALFAMHKHTRSDKTQSIDGNIELKSMSTISIGDKMGIGYSNNKAPNTTTQENSAEYMNRISIATSVEPADTINSYYVKGCQLNIDDLPNDAGYGSFVYAMRAPVSSSNTGSITSGGTTLTDTTKNYITDILAGAILFIYDSNGIAQEAYTIASNTATTITITGGTFSSTGTFGYMVTRQVYLGAANYPWRRLYTNEIRFGNGSSTGSQVIWIKQGTGSPEGVVTANIGSLYLRKDGGTNTTLYVKEGNTSVTTTTSGVVDLAGYYIMVDSTAGFSDSGTIVIDGQTITYQSKSGNTFQNCTGGSGNSTSNATVYQYNYAGGWAAI